MLDQDGLAGLHQPTQHEVNALLRTADHDDLLRPRLYGALEQVDGKLVPQERIALGSSIAVERSAVMGGDRLLHGPAELAQWKRLRGRGSLCKGDDLGLLRQLQEVGQFSGSPNVCGSGEQRLPMVDGACRTRCDKAAAA